MDKCVICDVQTLKYKCPKCFARYCSVPCCKAHKEKCSEMPGSNSTVTQPSPVSTETSVPHYPLWTAPVTSNKFPTENHEDDSVPAERLEFLRDNEQISELLNNPHLRAMCENLVNSENPSLEMAKAMQEPIFVELADECLRVVDRDNPHLEAVESIMDNL